MRIIKNIVMTLGLFGSSFECLAAARIPKGADRSLSKIYVKYKNSHDGKNASYIPELKKVNSDLFGIAIISVDGDMKSIGDVDTPFAIESISKPFVYALALQDNGENILADMVGLNATGHGFNSIEAIQEKADHLQNPYVNAGAIQVTSLIKGKGSDEKWQRVLNYIKQLSDGKPYLGMPVYQSEARTNQHNQLIAKLMKGYGLLSGDPKDAVMRYTKACSIMITAKELAIMGATLANGGVNPITHKRLMSKRIARDVLSEMVVNGLYENSGVWFWNVGLPSKSGVGGGLIAIVPGKMAIAVFSPPLDKAGNSVRAQHVILDLSRSLHLHILNQG